MKKQTIVHFGAGNIGRSLIGSLFCAAGYDIVFVDAQPEIVRALNDRGSYRLRILSDDPAEAREVTVSRVRGLLVSDRDAVAHAVAQADLVSTAVGARFLPGVCAQLAEGIARRTVPVSVLLCENLHGAARIAAQAFRDAAEAVGGVGCAEKLPAVGWVETSIGKMVPLMPEEVCRVDPLEVWAEAYNCIIANREAFVGGVPQVEGLDCKPDFAAYVDRKLFIHNLGHAACAAHGSLHGKRTIVEALDDPWIRAETKAVMRESADALLSAYPGVFTAIGLYAHADDLLRRFGNRALDDTVYRVGRDLPRKLGSSDRFIGALRLVQRAGLSGEHVCRAVAAALCFTGTDERGEMFAPDKEFHRKLSEQGVETTLRLECGLNRPGDAVWVGRIRDRYNAFCPAAAV